MMTQDELKKLVAQAALECGKSIPACVSSSVRSTQKLQALGYKVLDLNEIDEISVYVDGADEINADFDMIKGGGGALTREKIVASVSKKFVCIADESKKVDVLGRFPLPVEVIPMAVNAVAGKLRAMGGKPVERDFTTDNGNRILDVGGLQITDPKSMEDAVNAIAGVVTVGLFARRGADVLLLGTPQGVKKFER